MKENSLEEKRDKIVRGLEATYAKLVEFKKSKKSPLIVSKDGKVIQINPEAAEPTTTYNRG
ncbi:MAG: hypothetical protein H6584_07915 [Flavobacteriales bacterium]|nr:hypothetical protein [Flavobacteriales bacterium]